MRNAFRTLSVEAVEDRALPSALFQFAEPNFGYHSHAADFRAEDISFNRFEPVFQERSFRAESFFGVQVADNAILFFRGTPDGGFQLTTVNVSLPVTSSPAPVEGPVADGGTSATGGSGQSGDGGGGGNGPVAISHGPVRSPGTTPGTAIGDVAVAFPNQANANSASAAAEQNAVAAAAQAVAQGATPPVATVTQPLTGHGAGYAVTAVDPTDDMDDVGPPAVPAPMTSPAPAPVSDTGITAGIVQVAAAAVAPIAGFVPLDLSALQAGASQFLGRVGDLTPAWPDEMPGFSDSLWVAAAALLTGGAVHAAAARSAPRPARDPLASALSEWERRNGRQAG
jgi:hypothetical protein